MNSLNSVLLEGRVKEIFCIQYTKRGTSLFKFIIESKRFYKKEDDDQYIEEESYFEIIVWGRLADTCDKLLYKGRGVRVIGRLKQDRWKEKSKIFIVADHIEFLPVFNKKNDKEE